MTDYYATLGIERNASSDEINKAYRKVAMANHPDVNKEPEAVKRFKEASEAFEVLNNPDKRREYDQFGTVRSGTGPNIHNIDPFSSMFGDIFGSHFRQTHQTARGADVFKEIKITLAEAYHGCEKTLDLSDDKPCYKCEGTGAASWDHCPSCRGSGRINTQNGPFAVSVTCSRCQGRGRFQKDKCESCSGSGKIVGKIRQHNVSIPAGIETGIQIVLNGEGERVANGVPGNVICQIVIEPHPFYEREGNNLYCVVPITFAQSVVGYGMELPVFEKTCKIHVPAGTKSGQVLRVKGVGMPTLMNNHRQPSIIGDLLVRVQVEVPKNPSAEYLDLIKKLSEADDKEVYEDIKKFASQIEELKQC